MITTLYVPAKQPLALLTDQCAASVEAGRITPQFEHIAKLLKCPISFVDVLATGHGYALYSIFDCEGPVNPAAMQAFTELTSVQLNAEYEEDCLRGPVLSITI